MGEQKFMGIYEIIFLAWLFLSVGISLAKDGEPREGNHSFWIALLSAALQIFLLYKGGFFK